MPQTIALTRHAIFPVICLLAGTMMLSGCLGQADSGQVRLLGAHGHLEVKPTEIDGNGRDMPVITHVKWSHWGRDPVAGRGTLVVHTCRPACGKPGHVLVPVRLTADGIIGCAPGGTQYSTVDVRPTRSARIHVAAFPIPEAGCAESGPSG
ncbi:MAG: hypothetical protein QOJ38_170 [Solirubrobacterales bacterium]|jgi:hypothetical protein|nr:hypothetical protein [Solirubrobacterales bacterium]